MSFPSIQQILFITTSGRIRLFTQIHPLLAKIWRQRKRSFQQPPSIHFDDGNQVLYSWKSFISFHYVGSVKSWWNLLRNVLFSKREHVLVVLSFDKSRLKCVDFLPNLRVPGVKVSLLIFINSIIYTCWALIFTFSSIIIAHLDWQVKNIYFVFLYTDELRYKFKWKCLMLLSYNYSSTDIYIFLFLKISISSHLTLLTLS